MSYDKVRKRVEANRNVIRSIRKRQIKFSGHIPRKDGMEDCITGFVNSIGSRGRERITFLVKRFAQVEEWRSS